MGKNVSREGLVPKTTMYIIKQYIDPNSGNLCDDFIVKVDGVVVYRKDLGSCVDIIEAIEDYIMAGFIIKSNQ